MVKKSLVAICALGFALSFSPAARACMCRISSAEGTFAGADAVFIGKVIKNRSAKEATLVMVMKEAGTLELVKDPKWEPSVDKVRRVTLEVTEAFKGVSGKTVEVITDIYNGGGSCGVWFKEGESYLVYAHKRQPELSEVEAGLPKENWTREMRLKSEADKFNEKLPSLSTSICSRTRHLRWAGDDVETIRQIIKNGFPDEKKQAARPVRVISCAPPDNALERKPRARAFHRHSSRRMLSVALALPVVSGVGRPPEWVAD